MDRLFAQLYVDEDVDVAVAKMLRGRGFIVQTTRDAGRLGAEDSHQLAFAAGQGMVFLTHNRVDFEILHRLYLTEYKHHWGIIVAV